jgi:hypothetical protein
MSSRFKIDFFHPTNLFASSKLPVYGAMVHVPNCVLLGLNTTFESNIAYTAWYIIRN